MCEFPGSRFALLFTAVLLVLLGGCKDVNVTIVGASQVSISPSNTVVRVGATTRLTGSVLSSDGQTLAGRAIQWTSLNEDIASVDSTGLVLGLAAGDATIRATSEGVSGTAHVTVTSGPAIQATPGTVEFLGVHNGANPGDRAVALTNIGDGTLNGLDVSVSYPAGGPTGWLSANLAGRTAPATLVLGATLSGLPIGTYTATATITSPVASNSPFTLPVQLQVLAATPAIALGANTVGFSAVQNGGNPAAQAVAVTNAGGGTLTGLSVSVSYASGQPTGWLSATLGSSNAPTSITLAAATGSLAAGSYTATVRVASGVAQNSPQDITVTFTVGAAAPVIRAQPTSLTFSGTTPASQPVQLTNTGGGTLSGLSVSVIYPGGQPSGWLSTSLSGTTAPATLTVSAAAGTLAAGTYTATVRITAPGAANSPLDVPVSYTVPQPPPSPIIALGATIVGFNAVQGSGNPASQAVTVNNGGGGTLSGLTVSVIYPGGQPSGWLSATLGGTTAPTSITLNATTGSLTAGSYTATVRVASGVASNSPQDITVTFTVATPAPVIGAQPTSLTFTGTSPASQPVQITNNGGGTLSGLSVSVIYGGGQPTGWLSTSLSSTTAPATLTVSAAAGTMTAGTYTATVRIAAAGAANSPLDVPVTFTVPAPSPTIALGTTTVGFNAVQGGGNPASQAVAVTNAGGGTLSGLGVAVSYGSGQSGWLSATLGSTTAPTSITLNAATGSLAAGSYTATVRVTSAAASNSPQDITVTFTVSTPPSTINAQPTSLTFSGLSPVDQQIQLTNSGGGTLSGLAVSVSYSAGQPTGWLGTSLSSTTAPATVTVSANAAGLPGGTYMATVRITATGATNSPVDVPVTFTVPETPPGVPTGLTATAVSPSRIDLSWNAASGNVVDYRIERKTGAGGTYAQIQVVSGTTTAFQDTGLVASTDYFYQIVACNTAGCSAYSTEASATTLSGTPNSPTTLSAQGVSTTEIDLQWTHDGLLVTHFELERAPGSDPTNFQPLATPSGSARTYRDSGLTEATTYVYRIRACALVLCSAWSNPASGTTLTSIPAVPTGVTATALSSTQVSVSWNAVTGATHYDVQRQNVVGGKRTTVFTVTGATTYLDTGVAAATQYDYAVRACNVAGCSAYSPLVRVTTP